MNIMYKVSNTYYILKVTFKNNQTKLRVTLVHGTGNDFIPHKYCLGMHFNVFYDCVERVLRAYSQPRSSSIYCVESIRYSKKL